MTLLSITKLPCGQCWSLLYCRNSPACRRRYVPTNQRPAAVHTQINSISSSSSINSSFVHRTPRLLHAPLGRKIMHYNRSFTVSIKWVHSTKAVLRDTN